jgi:hypothetical protein
MTASTLIEPAWVWLRRLALDRRLTSRQPRLLQAIAS